MNTNMMELNMEEMKMTNGGFDWNRVISGSCFGGVIGMLGAGIAIAAMAKPVTLVAGGVAFVGTVTVGVATGGSVGAVVSAILDD